MEETWGSKEGRESMLIGGIVGLMTGGFGSVNTMLNAKEETEARARTVKMLNNPGIQTAIKSAQQAGASIAELVTAAQALEAGDHKQFRDAMGKLSSTGPCTHTAWRLDMYLEKLDDIAQMPDAEVVRHLVYLMV